MLITGNRVYRDDAELEFLRGKGGGQRRKKKDNQSERERGKDEFED